MVKVAFYKGIRPGIAGIYSHGVRFMTKSIYSHCEIIFSDGMSASSSFSDGGVRFKEIEYEPDRWDIIDMPGIDEAFAREWFVQHEGIKYDVIGNLHFVFAPIGNCTNGWFCSEAVAASLGITSPWRFDPGTLYPVVLALSEQLHRAQSQERVVAQESVHSA